MDKAVSFPEQRLFFTTGRLTGGALDAVDGLGLRPAVFARYRDLARLRYDYPVVLVAEGLGEGTVRSLSSIVDQVLTDAAPRGPEGERLRRHVLRLEREVRTMAQGQSGTLSEMWTQAAARCASPDDPSALEVLSHLATKLKLDGEVVDCGPSAAARVAEHLWRAAQRCKAKAFGAAVERLVVRLSDILRAAFLHSEAGQRPEALRAALGGSHRDAFDFEAMSRLVGRNAPKDELAPGRRARIERTLAVLKSQRFFADPRLPADPGRTLGFRFDDCAAAVEAFRARLPELAEVVKAIAIAELEADGRYVEGEHDAFFAGFDVHALSTDDLAFFPDYLVCIPSGRNDAPQNAGLMDILSAGLPVKILVESGDLLEEAAAGAGHFAFGVRSTRLANTATGLGGVFVVQAPSSHLHALRERLELAFAHRGATLLSVYAGGDGSTSALAPYLAAAAAMESRAFPAFVYDPFAGDNQAARFALADNPQPEADWPVSSLEYADENQQRLVEDTAFTLADFALCDRRYAGHFARVPRERWNGALVPADEWLAGDAAKQARTLPALLAVDANDVLQRVIVDAKLMQMAARVRTFWHRLQEQGGIHNSHAEILLAREKAKWDAERARELEQARSAAPEASAPAAAAASQAASAATPVAAAPLSAEAAPTRDPDEAWIETARCPSCNECQTINDRMFKYNDNKQAYIADITAGTYRELVEAAETCQVAIIHPGKPRNPDEPGLAELIERAKPFL
jgi:hypothetical protein